MRLLTLLSSLLIVFSIFGAEVDQFTFEKNILADSGEVINQFINKQMLRAIRATNKHKGCDAKLLLKNVNHQMRSASNGFVPELFDSPLIDRKVTPFKQSIYNNFKITETIILGSPVKYYKYVLAPEIKFYGVNVGLDKFEHFLGTGNRYFHKRIDKKYSAEEILAYGDYSERVLLGLPWTGVYSYGDLTANFNGMRFYNHILQTEDDILGANFNAGPIASCENGRWIQIKEIDLRNFIDYGWNESLNCSGLKSQSFLDKLVANLPQGATCPMSQEKIDSVLSKYGVLAPSLINPNGFKVMD